MSREIAGTLKGKINDPEKDNILSGFKKRSITLSKNKIRKDAKLAVAGCSHLQQRVERRLRHRALCASPRPRCSRHF